MTNVERQVRERIRMVMDTAHVPWLDFLDEKGGVVARYPR